MRRTATRRKGKARHRSAQQRRSAAPHRTAKARQGPARHSKGKVNIYQGDYSNGNGDRWRVVVDRASVGDMNPIGVRSIYINGWRYMREKGFTHDEYTTTDIVVRGGNAVMRRMEKDAQESQIVIFDQEQVMVFWDLIRRKNFVPALDWRLPFPRTWIHFSSPILLSGVDEAGNNGAHQALLLTQDYSVEGIQLKDSLNRLVVLHQDSGPVLVEWWSHLTERYEVVPKWAKDVDRLGLMYRALAAACIEYINCENIYLEKQGEVPEAVNRKREKKGKSRLEPYYVCRIRGVQYDSTETGEGSKHGIRYDVRGHFRRLTTGKTIWVRPHQRGLTNELYIPKVYIVDKGVKDYGNGKM